MWTLGLGGGYFHDSSACLFHGTELISYIEEERISRSRYAPGARPLHCILTCLAEANIEICDVDVVALSWNPYFPKDIDEIPLTDPLVSELFPEDIFGKLRAKILIIDHQLSHAASAYRTFKEDDALVISVDGSGDGKSLAIYRGQNGKLTEINSFDITQSLGWFYQRVTTYLGIGNWHHAGKTMALAALGEPVYKFDFIEINTDGYTFKHPHGIPYKQLKKPPQEVRSAYYKRQKEFLYNYFKGLGIPNESPCTEVDRITGNRIYKTPIPEICNLAASAQNVIEEALTSLADKYLKTFNLKSLCLAGGVAMNCKAIGTLALRLKGLENLYVPPFAGDMGGAIGAALESMSRLNICNKIEFNHAYHGPGFTDLEINNLLTDIGIKSQFIDDPSACAADLIANDKIIGWFQGRMEVGQRALGNRSILARPDSKKISDTLNKNIKNRESWRPFSPSAIESSKFHKSWQLTNMASPFMTIALPENPNSGLVGVTHIDGTSRVQKVEEVYNKRYSDLINFVGQNIDIPIVLNTSLNARDEPMVCKPIEALRVFITTPLDALIIGRNLILK